MVVYDVDELRKEIILTIFVIILLGICIILIAVMIKRIGVEFARAHMREILEKKELEELRIEEQRKIDFFSKRYLVNVTPKYDFSDSWARIINELESNEEIFFLAEYVQGDIRINVEMKNGKVYKNVLHSTSFKWFESNFDVLED